jgi:hypothetical protein
MAVRWAATPQSEKGAAPVFLPGAGELFAAFQDCHTDRPIGFAMGPIPFTAIDAWARRHGWGDPEEFALLNRMVRAMDLEWLAMQQPNPEAPATAVRKMTPELFKAMFG